MAETFHQRLLDQTASARQDFMAFPVIQRALSGDVDRARYLSFLTEAYHHVSQTVPLLAQALSRCGAPWSTRASLPHHVRLCAGDD
jgi:pyrroloquinoline quinone (PQQ) biosynthesis protein C